MENNQQPLPSQQQTDQLHSVSPKTSYHPSTTFIILMVVLLTITVGLGGYILGVNQNQILRSQTQPVTPITQPSPTPVDKTANWKTYTNNAYVYSVRYPNSWNIGYYPSGTTPETTGIILFDKFKEGSVSITGQVTIGVLAAKNKQSLSLKDFIINDGISIDYPLVIDFLNQEAELNHRKEQIRKMQATSFRGYEALQDTEKRIFINTGDTIFLIFIHSSEEISNDDKNIFDQILSTFKFTDQNQTPSPPSYPSYAPDNPAIEEEGKLKVQNTSEVQTLIGKYGGNNVSIKALDVNLVKDIQFIMQIDQRFKEQTGCIIVVSSNNIGYVYQLDKNNEILYRQTLEAFKQKTANVNQQILAQFYSSLK